MSKKFLIIRSDDQQKAIDLRESLREQGIEEECYLLVYGGGNIDITLDGKRLTAKNDECLTSNQIDDLKTIIVNRCNDHLPIAKTTFNWLFVVFGAIGLFTLVMAILVVVLGIKS